MDATSLHNDEDMFAEIRLALRLNRQPFLDAPASSPADALALATIGGAKLLGKDRRLGRLAPGFAADMVVLDLDRVLAPWAAPECDPLELIVLRAGRRDVDTVLVAGEVVFADGMPTRFDLTAAGRSFVELMTRTAFPAAAAEALRHIQPHVEAWYRDWPLPEPQPYTAYNSRR